MKKVLEAAGIEVDEVRIKALVAGLKEVDIDEAIKTAALPVAAAAAPAPAAQAAAGGEEEEKKEEEEEEEAASEEDIAAGLGALFG